jgi:nucleoside-diphosphate-sugar epimerase
MRVFLTGVSGYLGSLLARQLAALPQIESITGIDILPPRGALPNKVVFMQQDIRSPAVVSVMTGHDVVVHTAFIVLWNSRMSARERDDISINGARNVAKAARLSQIPKLVHASSIAAYSTAPPPQGIVTEDFPLDDGSSGWYYTHCKAAAERAIHEVLDGTPIRLTILRPSLIVGPSNRDTVSNLQRNNIQIPGSNPSQQWVHEEDVAAAFLRAVTGELPGAYNVVPDDAIPLSEAQRLMGIERPRPVPYWLAKTTLALDWRFINGPTHPSWLDALWRFDGRFFSNAKLRGTGWHPRFTSAQAVSDAVGERTKPTGGR